MAQFTVTTRHRTKEETIIKAKTTGCRVIFTEKEAYGRRCTPIALIRSLPDDVLIRDDNGYPYHLHVYTAIYLESIKPLLKTDQKLIDTSSLFGSLLSKSKKMCKKA